MGLLSTEDVRPSLCCPLLSPRPETAAFNDHRRQGEGLCCSPTRPRDQKIAAKVKRKSPSWESQHWTAQRRSESSPALWSRVWATKQLGFSRPLLLAKQPGMPQLVFGTLKLAQLVTVLISPMALLKTDPGPGRQLGKLPR